MEPQQPIVLPRIPEGLQPKLEAHGHHRTIPKGTVLYEEGFPCPLVPLVLSGKVRVFKLGESGREITLYRVESGQICVLSSSCAATGQEARLPAVAVAESDVELLALPVHVFKRLLVELPELQNYINTMLTGRLSEMMGVVDGVAFGRVDQRLAEMLLAEARRRPDGVVESTHAALAVELGSAREVVSRILKDFERQGLVSLGRRRITVTDPRALKAFAGSHGN